MERRIANLISDLEEIDADFALADGEWRDAIFRFDGVLSKIFGRREREPETENRRDADRAAAGVNRMISDSSAKSLVLTCLLWLTLGWFGAHHFYLGRDRHGFLWITTLGGGFGVGWLAEISRLPAYVRAANGKSARRPTGDQTTGDCRPPVAWERLLGELTFSMYLSGMSVLTAAALMKTCWLLEIVIAHPFLHPVLPLCIGAFAIAAGDI